MNQSGERMDRFLKIALCSFCVTVSLGCAQVETGPEALDTQASTSAKASTNEAEKLKAFQDQERLAKQQAEEEQRQAELVERDNQSTKPSASRKTAKQIADSRRDEKIAKENAIAAARAEVRKKHISDMRSDPDGYMRKHAGMLDALSSLMRGCVASAKVYGKSDALTQPECVKAMSIVNDPDAAAAVDIVSLIANETEHSSAVWLEYFSELNDAQSIAKSVDTLSFL